MMPIAALASDLALFDFPVFFVAIFLFPRIDMKVSFAQIPGFPASQMPAPFLQPSRPLLLSIPFTAENGPFFRSPPSPPSSPIPSPPPPPPNTHPPQPHTPNPPNR